MYRPLTPWETEILDQLEAASQAEGLGLKGLAAKLGLKYDMVYRMLQREQGIGPRTLEVLRQAEPMLVAEAFVPEGYALTPIHLPGDRTTVNATPGNSRPREAEPCAP